ncbi:MAG: FKBP-type peptidyl-prolyl cis-trans isomerase [Bacteroidota bacterium]|jgi:FKBP-type peptidyl-prolyl cis-trans isomerase
MCCNDSGQTINPKTPIDKIKVKQQFIKANQSVVLKENDEMDYFQKSHQFNFIKTTSGIRYFVYKPSIKGDSIANGDVITIKYTLSLLDGTVCYSSEKDGVKEFKVGMQDVEDGLHKAVVHFKLWDRALILIPSHLAHGLLGDYKKIPPQSPILYDIEVISLKKDREF